MKTETTIRSQTTKPRKSKKNAILAILLVILLAIIVTAISTAYICKKVERINENKLYNESHLTITGYVITPKESGVEKIELPESPTYADYLHAAKLQKARENKKTNVSSVHHTFGEHEVSIFGGDGDKLEILAKGNDFTIYEFGAFSKYQIENAEDTIVVKNDDDGICFWIRGKLFYYSICDDQFMEVASNVRYAFLGKDNKIIVQDNNAYLYVIEKTSNEEDPFNAKLMFNENQILVKPTNFF